MADSAAEQSGTVKTYNGVKGFGFITGSTLQEGDIFFGRDALQDDAKEVQGKFLEGRTVYFNAVQQDDGRYKATSVAVPYEEGKPVAGKIKSFSEKNGYGFANSSALEADVHFKAEIVPQHVPGISLKDELIIFEVKTLPDGKTSATSMRFQSGKIWDRLKGGEMGMGMMGMGMMDMGMMGYGKGGPMMGGPMMGGYGGPMMGGPMMGGPMMDGPMMGGGMMGGKSSGKGSSSKSSGVPRAFEKPTPSSAPSSSSGSSEKAQGVVKSYSEKNGYGFINVPGMPMDIKFGRQDLMQLGNIEPGTEVTFACVQDNMGRFVAQQVRVKGAAGAMSPSGGVKRPAPSSGKGMGGGMGGMGMGMGGMGMGMGGPAKMQRTSNAEHGTGRYLQGAIKSFNPQKGFGFIQSPGLSGDAFFMANSLPGQMQGANGQMLQGTPVSFEVAQTPDGKTRAINISM
eukprot:CAMPEP_0197665064 /NCGR_PEP_ID=MMETSP1338-20131121/59013_1 /TAXON_ID=43686 ORGANISM="Pelagodinium beii, Strain RCC1491" /NCGR_SAMPLE_ID=MMETSP1338 /ASSEMBLY_ACC=CAM_ASM_000754 /LENGTH=453 /DNA_ID=CAMNT_0043243817 /DNA_START=41 /DNA_END=1402 /DNA_ORIENTATION=-